MGYVPGPPFVFWGECEGLLPREGGGIGAVEEFFAGDEAVFDGVDGDFAVVAALAGGFGGDVEIEQDGELVVEQEGAFGGGAVDFVGGGPFLAFFDDGGLAGGFKVACFAAGGFDGDDVVVIEGLHDFEVLALLAEGDELGGEFGSGHG